MTQTQIPVLKPLLPPSDMIIPYMMEIDRNRWYSNFGPLTFRLMQRIADHFGVERDAVGTLSSATSGLTALLRVMGVTREGLCLLPSWTFAATAAAPYSLGLIPHFLDVDEKTWALTPEIVREFLPYAERPVEAVITVAPFGSPVDVAAWDEFTRETKIPVIIDAAAAFDAVATCPQMKPGKTPMVISMHATKTLGIGEGGLIICKDEGLVARAMQMVNFGFSPNRKITVPGTNGKMSEYDAAIALAALDWWPQKREMYARVTDTYLKAFAEINSLGIEPWLSTQWVGSTCCVKLPTASADYMIHRLGGVGIEARKWWANGCHTQHAYAHCPHSDLVHTEILTKSVVSLPYWPDLPDADIHRIVEVVRSMAKTSNSYTDSLSSLT